MNATLTTLLTLTALALAPAALAQDGPPTGRDGTPPPPPPEALQACVGLGDGEACGFDSPHGSVAGSCWAPSEDLPLACRPANAPPPR
jgi:hypothetical protein